MIMGIVHAMVAFNDAHVRSLNENLRFSNFPKRRPRGRTAGNIGIQVITTVLYADEVRVAADDVMCKIKEWAMQNTDYSPLEKRSYLERIREWLSPAHT